MLGFLRWTVGLAAAWLLTASAASPAREALDRQAADLFAGPILRFEIRLARPEVQKLRREPRTYVPATVLVAGQTFSEVGIHLKGAAGSSRGIDDKPALTLNFDKFKPDQTCFGLEKFHLNNSVQDDSYLNELVGSELYRRAGLPTARATHAWVTLNGRDLGLYVLKEGYDRLFLKRNFPPGKAELGNLYDGGFLQDITEELKRDVGKGPEDRQDLQALVKAADTPVVQRQARLEAVLDVDRFLTFLSGQILTDDWDGYARNRNNYRLYFGPPTGRAVFIPHGMDQLFTETGSSIEPGWGGMLAQQVLEVPSFRDRYRERLTSMLTNHFTPAVLSNQLQNVIGRLRFAHQGRPATEWAQLEPELKDRQRRILRRMANVERQLGLNPSANPAGEIPTLSDWQPRPRDGRSQLEIKEWKPDQPALHLTALSSRTVASFRTSIWLEAGEYTFSGHARCQGVKGGTGAGLRISGQQRRAGLSGDRDWSVVTFHFRVDEDRDVELVAELEADRGEAWFEVNSLKVTRK